MTSQTGGYRKPVLSSQLIRLLLIIGLILILQIPILMVNDLVRERSYSRVQATEEITKKWGRAQVLVGPRLVIPVTEEGENGHITEQTLVLMPESFTADADLSSEIRRRGIYDVPLYRAKIALEGAFNIADAPPLAANQTPHWERANLVLSVTDPKAIHSAEPLIWKGGELELQPGTGPITGNSGGFHTAVKIDLTDKRHSFSLGLTLGGHDLLSISPAGRSSTIRITSDWPDPSFQGNWLPKRHKVTEEGFSAEWEIPFLGRNFPTGWLVGRGPSEAVLQNSTVGVKLLNSLDTYGRVTRSTKYDLIFIGLTFLCFWLLEVLGKVRIHPAQYLLVGSAISLFYLLLLSLAEHIGFTPAYLVATLMVVGLVFSYVRHLMESNRNSALFSCALAALYGYLFALLHEQRYALLAGSVGLFLVLGLVMYLTRRVNWYQDEVTMP